MLKEMDGRKAIYIGTGVGLILFVLLGFFPSAMMGGYVGLKLAELMMGPGSMGVIARVLTAVSMIGAVVVTAVAFVLGGALAGYLVAGRLGKRAEAKAKA